MKVCFQGMKTFTNSILGLTLSVITIAILINAEVGYSLLAAAGVLGIAISDYSTRPAINI